VEEARALQYGINKVINVILKYGCWRAVKAGLTLNGIDVGQPAFPMKPLVGDELQAFRRDMEAAGYAFRA
jgi:dihydrodipicolinate synthase/N-acetylneuraminate lyase